LLITPLDKLKHHIGLQKTFATITTVYMPPQPQPKFEQQLQHPCATMTVTVTICGAIVVSATTLQQQ